MSEEYIKRADVVKLLDDTWVDGTEYMGYLHGDLKKIPTADVRENVRGEWREENPREKSMMWRCSVCGRIAYYPTIGERKNYKKHCGYNYCPNCGADMRGES